MRNQASEDLKQADPPAPAGLADEAELIRRAKERDSEAWRVIWDRHHETIFRYARARLRAPEDAEDAVSQTFLRALRSIRTYTYHGRPFISWLIRIAENVVKDQARRNRDRRETLVHDLDNVSAQIGPETQLSRLDLLSAIDRLKKDHRDVVILRFFIGLPTREVAAILGKTEAAVYSLQVRAVESLRRRLK